MRNVQGNRCGAWPASRSGEREEAREGLSGEPEESEVVDEECVLVLEEMDVLRDLDLPLVRC